MIRDTYCCLEFQGVVSSVPTWDEEELRLRFEAKARLLPTLRFEAAGERAKAARGVLRKGDLVSVFAIPAMGRPKAKKGRGRRPKATLVWEVRRLRLVLREAVNLRRFEDPGVLEGLMPSRDEAGEIGWVAFKRGTLRREGGRK